MDHKPRRKRRYVVWSAHRGEGTAKTILASNAVHAVREYTFYLGDRHGWMEASAIVEADLMVEFPDGSRARVGMVWEWGEMPELTELVPLT